MGCSTYVGRVGALAVALGVGWAATVGTGVATAEPSADTSAGPSDSSPAADTGASTPSSSAGAESPSATSGAPTTTSTSTSASGYTSTTTSGDGPSSSVSSSGGALTSERATGTSVPGEPDVEVEAESPTSDPGTPSTPTPSVPPPTPSADAEPTGPTPAPASSTSARPEPVADRPSPSARPDGPSTPTTAATGTTVGGVRQTLVAGATPPDATRAATARTASAEQLAVPAANTAQAAPADAGPVAALLRLPGAFLDAAAGMVAVVLSPLLAPGPATPAPSPTLFAVLAWVRREVERTFFNSAPTIAYPASGNSQDVNGRVTGSVVVTDRDGDPVSLSASTPVNGGAVTLRPDGTFTYTPTAELARTGGVDSFTVTAVSTGGGLHLQDVGAALARLDLVGALVALTSPPTTTRVITVAVRPINQAPVARDDAFTVDEDTTLTGDVSTNDTDVNVPDTKSYAVVTTTANGALTLRADGTFEYTPASNYSGTDGFTYSVADAEGARSTATVTINVAPVNDAPVAGSPGPQTVDYATGAVSGTIGFTDVDGDDLTFTVNQPASGRVTYDAATGRYTFTPTVADRLQANLTTGTDQRTFTITASDGTASAAVTITAVVDPARVVVVGTIPTGSSIVDVDVVGTRAYVIGSDGVLKTIDTRTNAVIGTVKINGVSGTEYLDASNDGKYVYVSAGNGGNGVVVIVDTATGAQTPVAVGRLARDLLEVTLPDGQRLVYVTTRSSAGNRVAIVDPASPASVRYVDLPAGAGPNNIAASRDGRFVYVTRNEGGNSLSVIDTSTNTVVSTTALGNNPQGLDVSADGRYVYVANGGGTNVTVLDTTNGGLSQISVGNASRGVRVSPDGSFAYVTLTNGQVAVIDTSTNTTVGTPTVVGSGAQYTAFASDGTAYTSNFSLGTVSVLSIVSTSLNTAPVSVRPPVVGTPNATTGVVTGRLGVTDADGDQLVYAPVSGTSARGTYTVAADGSFTYRPTDDARHAAAAVGAPSTTFDQFSVTVTDGRGGSQVVAVSVVVSPRNAAPVLVSNPPPSAPGTDGTVTGRVTFTDPDGDPLSYAVTTNPKGQLAIAPDGSYTFTPTSAAMLAAGAVAATAAEREATYTVSATDGYGGVSTAGITVSIRPQPVAPVALVGFEFDVIEDTVFTGTLVGLANDANGDPLTFQVERTPTRGTLVLAPDGTYTYTPLRDLYGIDVFSFTAYDGVLRSEQGFVTFGVSPRNDAPVAGTVVLTTPTNASVTGTLTASDVDSNDLTFSGSGKTAKGTVVINGNGNFRYTPDPNVSGSDTFSFTVSDGALSSTGTITVTIQPAAGAVLVDPETPVSLNTLPGNTFGSSAGTVNTTRGGLTYTVVNQPTSGTFTIGADGAFTYTPDPVRRVAATGTASTADDVDTVVVRVSDGVTSQTVTITPSVSPVSVAPVYQAPMGTTSVGTVTIDANGAGFLTVRTTDGNYAIVVTAPGGAPARVVALPGTPVDDVYLDGRVAVQYSRTADGTISATVIRAAGATTTALPGSPTGRFVDNGTGTVYVVSESSTGAHAVTVLPAAGPSSTISLPGAPGDLIARSDGSYYTVTTSATGDHAIVVIRTDATAFSTPLTGTPATEGIPGKAGLLTFLTRSTDGTSALTVLRLDGTSSTTVVPGTAITAPFVDARGFLAVRSVQQNGNSLTDYVTTVGDDGAVEVRQGGTRNLGGTLVGTVGYLGEDAATRYYTVLLPKTLSTDPDRYQLVVQNGDFTRQFALTGSPLDERDRVRPTSTNVDTDTVYLVTTLRPDRGEPVDYVTVVDTRLLVSKTVALPGGISIEPIIDPVSGTAFIVSNDLTNQWVTVLNVVDGPTIIPVAGNFERTEFFVTGGVGRVVTNAAGTYALLTVDSTGRAQTTALGGTPVGGYVVDPVSGNIVQAVSSNGQSSLVVVAPDGSSSTAVLPGLLADGPFASGRSGVIRALVKTPGINGAYSIATIRPDGTVVTAALGTTMNPTVIELEDSFIVRVRAGSSYGVAVVRDDGSTVGISIPGVPVEDYGVDGSGRTYFTSVSGTTTSITIVSPDGTSTVRTVPGRASTAVTFGPSGAFQLTDAGLFALAGPTDTNRL